LPDKQISWALRTWHTQQRRRSVGAKKKKLFLRLRKCQQLGGGPNFEPHLPLNIGFCSNDSPPPAAAGAECETHHGEVSQDTKKEVSVCGLLRMEKSLAR